MSKLTIRDIAQMAGVSATAVSFVLNDRPGVSDATRQRVQEIIRRTGFIPNVHTRRLNLGRSMTLHVVLQWYVQNVFNQFALETLFGIFQASKALGYSVVFTFVNNSADCEQLMEAVRSKDCDGVILFQVSDPVFLSLLRREGIPFLCTDAHVPKDGALPLVEVDYYQAAQSATGYLIRRGHREIGFIGLASHGEYGETTYRGYADALAAAGLDYNPSWTLRLPFSEAAATTEIEGLLRNPRLPTAFFCASDPFAVNVIRCAKDRGLRVPEDLSVVGLDDLLMSRYVDPPLTTMAFDKTRLGEMSVQLLVKILQEEDYDPVNLLPTTLVERGSVRDLRA